MVLNTALNNQIPSKLTLHNLGNDFSAHTILWPTLLASNTMIRLFDRVDNSLLVQRPQRPQINDLTVNSHLGHLFGSLHTELDRPRVRNQRDVLADALDLGLANRHDEVTRERLLRHRKGHVVHDLILENHDRIGVADGGFEQAFGVLGRPGRDHLQRYKIAMSNRKKQLL